MPNQQKNSALPPLREDIQLLPGAPTRDGMPTWTLFDPVRNQYFQIGWVAYQLLSRWNGQSTIQVIEQTHAETTCHVTPQDVEDLIQFLNANHLTRESPTGTSHTFVSQAEAQDTQGLQWWMHQYLFLRIPLVRPDRLLQATMPLVAPLFTKTAFGIILLLGLVGMLLVSRQWNTFLNTFPHLFTLEGMIAFGVTLSLVKILHELGHAYTATRYGCRIQTMGVAFLVMVPVLFTDTTDAWRLTSRRQRVLIGAAGILTELAIALVATFFWNFLPDGIGRSIMFILATTSWVMSLVINLNPCLRFDGYYLLSDWLGVPNLQARAFAFGRWKLREWLFALGDPPPEPVRPGLRTTLIAYAWSVWIFRFFLLLGIALIVYYFFFKILGIILFAVEMYWFIILPMSQEMREWWTRKDQIAQTRRSLISGLAVGVVLLLVIIPWNTRVSLPAVQQAAQYTKIFAPTPARIVNVFIQKGLTVTKGDALITLASPHIEHDLALTQHHIDLLQLRLRRQASQPKKLAETHVLLEELHTRILERQGLQEQQEQLILRAPFSGIITDVPEPLHPGQWVNHTAPLVHLVQPRTTHYLALTSEIDLALVALGQHATFIPDDPARPSIPAQIREIRQVDEGASLAPYFASTLGGEVPVRVDAEGKLYPEIAMYRVSLTALGSQPAGSQAVRGIIHVDGRPRSLIKDLYQHIAAVLIREAGF